MHTYKVTGPITNALLNSINSSRTTCYAYGKKKTWTLTSKEINRINLRWIIALNEKGEIIMSLEEKQNSTFMSLW